VDSSGSDTTLWRAAANTIVKLLLLTCGEVSDLVRKC